EAVVNDAEEEHAEEDAEHLAGAAEQADAADHRGADDVEEDALAEDRRARLEAAGIDDRRDRREEAGDDEGPDDDAVDRHARDGGGLRVEPDGEEPLAEHRARLDDVGADG